MGPDVRTGFGCSCLTGRVAALSPYDRAHRPKTRCYIRRLGERRLVYCFLRCCQLFIGLYASYWAFDRSRYICAVGLGTRDRRVSWPHPGPAVPASFPARRPVAPPGFLIQGSAPRMKGLRMPGFRRSHDAGMGPGRARRKRLPPVVQNSPWPPLPSVGVRIAWPGLPGTPTRPASFGHDGRTFFVRVRGCPPPR